jgi:ribosomal protein S18 acetylase RimI-like enzyme
MIQAEVVHRSSPDAARAKVDLPALNELRLAGHLKPRIEKAQMVEVVIRGATVADSEAIATLVSGLGYLTTTEQMRERLKSILADKDYDTLVAHRGEQIVGFIGVRVGRLYESDDRYGQIMALAVATNHQRRGVGGRLIRAAESLLMARGAQLSVVTSGNHRADAHEFYEKKGYAFTGRRYMKSLP